MKAKLRKVWHFTQKHREPYKTHWLLEYQLSKLPCNVSGQIKIDKWHITYIDVCALRNMWRLQFLQKYNDFFSTNHSPYILDCGSNIGISVLRYKQLFPGSRIIAFEPDPGIYPVLEKNVHNNALKNVETVNAAVWIENTKLEFHSLVGMDSQAGHLRTIGRRDAPECITVPAVWLGNYLQQEVDFLKLDIEGAELAVLESVQGQLHSVKQLIVEVHHNVDQAEFLIRILDILKTANFNIAIYQCHGPSRWKSFERRTHSAADQFPIIWAWRI